MKTIPLVAARMNFVLWGELIPLLLNRGLKITGTIRRDNRPLLRTRKINWFKSKTLNHLNKLLHAVFHIEVLGLGIFDMFAYFIEFRLKFFKIILQSHDCGFDFL